MKDYKNLQVWVKAHQLTLAVYAATKVFPKEELYGLTSQIRCAVVSIPANIAEGCGKDGDAELGRYCQIAMGSASELDYHLLLAHELEMLDSVIYQNLNQQLTEVRRMLNALIQKLKANR